jgi:hypothetical protein
MNNIKNFKDFVNEEVTDSYLRDKIAKAKEGGRQISSGYEEELHKKRFGLERADRDRKIVEEREQTEKKWREFQAKSDDIFSFLGGKVFSVDGLPFKVVQVRPSIGPVLEIHLKPTETEKIDKLVVSYFQKLDAIKAYIYEGTNSGQLFPIVRLSEMFGTLAQMFKKFFPESKFADRKVYSALESVSVDEDGKVNELFGRRRDMRTRRNLENIKDISDRQKENSPEGKLAKYTKMRDDLIKELEDSLEEDEE